MYLSEIRDLTYWKELLFEGFLNSDCEKELGFPASLPYFITFECPNVEPVNKHILAICMCANFDSQLK